MSYSFDGGCLCGSVRFTCDAKPINVFYCHCLDCQKESGCPFITEIYIAKSSVEITGDTTRYSQLGDSGKLVHRNFCTACGTVILSEFDAEPDNVCLKACSLDDPSWLTPEFHLYISRKQPWLTISDGLPQHEADF